MLTCIGQNKSEKRTEYVLKLRNTRIGVSVYSVLFKFNTDYKLSFSFVGFLKYTFPSVNSCAAINVGFGSFS